MPAMKQCPQCGKYVPTDRTYCMNCGVTLGIRCPNCRAVLPVGTKVCTECGHSFVQKKKLFRFPLWDQMKKHPRPVLGVSVLLLTVFMLVAAALPAVPVRVLMQDIPVSDSDVTGYELMLYFLSAKPDSISSLLANRHFKDVATTLQVLFFGEGVVLLVVLCGLILAVCLLACNYKKLSRVTAKRAFAPLGVVFGGAAGLFALSLVTSRVVRDALLESFSDNRFSLKVFPLWPLLLLIFSAVVFAVQTLLYVGVLRHNEPEREELSLTRILSVPLSLTGRGLRAVRRRFRKKSKQEKEAEEPSFAVTPRFSTYFILLGISLVFTQALLSKISNIFFWFVFLLPPVLIIYVTLAKHALEVKMVSATATTEKNTPYTYEFHIDNRSVLALPFVEAKVSIPQSNSVRCSRRIVRLSLAPMTGYCMKNTVSFRFRGTYDIGVECFYVYDFFRLFRARVEVENMTTVYVLPRRLSLDETLAQAISDSTTRTVRSPLVVDKLEVSDIRDYQNGDPLKSIHWKLSSKSENFVVKDYNTGTANQTVVFCDMAPHFPDEPPSKKEEAAKAAPLQKKKNRAERRAEHRAKRRAEIAARKETIHAESSRVAKARRARERQNEDIHALSAEELQERLDRRAAAANILGADKARQAATSEAVDAPEIIEVANEAVNVHELARPIHYEDMNEYLADGVVELTIAMVLAELRQGHEVLLLWFDRRSASGVFAYPLRGIDEFESIYYLFATAPLCDTAKDRKVTSLTAMASHMQSAKQLFVVSTLDTEMMSDLTALPGVSDASSFGSTEVVLYNPEERFKYSMERLSYLDGCREQLSANGISLTAGSFNIARPAQSTEGGK